MSLRQLAAAVGWDASMFGKMETGESLGSPDIVEALDQYYGCTPLLLALWELALSDPSRFKEQYQKYMTLEADAVALWHFAPSAPPGLLQTEAYARAALAAGGFTGEELDQQTEARLSRQKLLEGPDAPTFRVILYEAVLRTALPDPDEWREQLRYFLEASERPNITLQVLPFSVGPHALMNTALKLMRLPDGRTMGYTENDVRGELIEESSQVEEWQRRYDAVRDLALKPAESRTFIVQVLEEVSCEPST